MKTAARRLPALLALGALAACSQTTGREGAAQEKEKKQMGGLVIGAIPKVKAVLPGESFTVEATFENRGAAPVELPNREDPSPVAYDLLRDKDRSVRYVVSQDLRDTRRARDIPPPVDRPPETLAPGSSRERDEDLAELAGEDFEPGKYLIRARYPFEGEPEAASALAPFTVLVPHIESFSSFVCGSRKALATAYAHRREDGGVLVMQRDALSDPREGVAFRRLQLEPGPPVQVAVAIDAVNAGNGRWFGWLRDGSFAAAFGWGNRLITRRDPVRAGAADTVLLSPAFQVDVGVGLFGFIVNANGAARLKTVRVSSAGIANGFETELAPQAVRNVRWNYRPEAGISVYWEDARGFVYRRSFSVQGAAIDPAPVATSGMAPIAWSVEPLGEPDLLAAVRVPDGRYFFRDLGGAAGRAAAPPAQLADLPEGVAAAPPFAFCRTADGQTKVVAAGAGKIWVATASGNGAGAWQPVAEAAKPAFLHAFTPRGRTCWVEWLETDVGLRRAPLP